MSLTKLFLLYIKIGAILLGGGYVILPIMQDEFVEKRKLISQDDLINYFTLSQSLPGIIAANMSMFIGYKLKGKSGAIVAMFGIITIPVLIIITLASFIDLLANNIFIKNALWGVGIGVVALILLTAKETWQHSKRNLSFYLIFLMSLAGLLIFNLSPIQTIVIFSVLGILIQICKKRSRE